MTWACKNEEWLKRYGETIRGLRDGGNTAIPLVSAFATASGLALWNAIALCEG